MDSGHEVDIDFVLSGEVGPQNRYPLGFSDIKNTAHTVFFFCIPTSTQEMESQRKSHSLNQARFLGSLMM